MAIGEAGELHGTSLKQIGWEVASRDYFVAPKIIVLSAQIPNTWNLRSKLLNTPSPPFQRLLVGSHVQRASLKGMLGQWEGQECYISSERSEEEIDIIS